MRPQDIMWNRQKEENRLHNEQLRHGWDGAIFFERGVRRLPREGIIFERPNIAS